MKKCGDRPVIMQYLAELIRSQLDNRMPDAIPEGITVEEIIDIAARGNMQYLVLGALIRLPLSEDNLLAVRNRLKASTLQTMMQVICAKQLDQELEKAGVRHQLLKGSVLKHIYPKPELREMSDVDIMIYDDIELADPIITGLGLSRLEAVKHHVIYRQPPYLIVESHWDLYEKTVDKEQYLYYKDNFRVRLKEGTQYTYEFSKEDFYVYMVSHMAKHFYEQGCGVRNLVDLYVYNNAYGEQMDRKYIDDELTKLGISDFECHMVKLAFIWLDRMPSECFYNDLFLYMIDCGIYGKRENGMWGQMAKNNVTQKGNMVHNFYFPPYSYMTEHYPWLEGKPVLLPIAWFVRGIHGLTAKESLERKEKLVKMDNEEAKKISSMYQALNLDFRK